MQEGKMSSPLIGQSQVIQNIKTLIGKVARTGENILIFGETGVGKDLVAQKIYHQSNRSGKLFVKLNCAILNESLFDIQTSCFDEAGSKETVIKQSGLFENISGGILYLDNIDLMSPAHQSEILTFLQNDNHSIVDPTVPVSEAICIISSTNQDLEKMVKGGKFSKSLFFTLSTFKIDIKPLRERPEDIPSLIDYYCKKYLSTNNGQKAMVLDRKIIDELCAYHWPGNVRELQNLLKRIVFLEDKDGNNSDQIPTSRVGDKSIDDESTKNMMPFSKSVFYLMDMHGPELMSLPFKEAKKKIVNFAEKELISNALKKTKWNRSKASKDLCISYRTLLSKIERLNIQPLQ